MSAMQEDLPIASVSEADSSELLQSMLTSRFTMCTIGLRNSGLKQQLLTLLAEWATVRPDLLIVSAAPQMKELADLLHPACALSGGSKKDLMNQIAEVLHDQLKLMQDPATPAPRLLLLLDAFQHNLWSSLPAVRAAVLDGHKRLNTSVVIVGENIRCIPPWVRDNATHVLQAYTGNKVMLTEAFERLPVIGVDSYKDFVQRMDAATNNYACALWTRLTSTLTTRRANLRTLSDLQELIKHDAGRRVGSALVSRYSELVANEAWLETQDPWQMLLNDFRV